MTQRTVCTSGAGIDVIIIEFSKVIDLVPNDRLVINPEASGVDSRATVWVREFIQYAGGGRLLKELKFISVVPQRGLLGALLFLVYVNDIWRNVDWSIRLVAVDCIICRKNTNNNDIENLQNYLDTRGEWAEENEMEINPGKRKTIRFTTARFKNLLGYCLGTQKFRNGAVLNTME
jgi:hypothetical protein